MGRQKHCLFCKSTEHRTRNCASQGDLIDFSDPIEPTHSQSTSEKHFGKPSLLVFTDGASAATSFAAHSIATSSPTEAVVSRKIVSSTSCNGSASPMTHSGKLDSLICHDKHFVHEPREAITRSLEEQGNHKYEIPDPYLAVDAKIQFIHLDDGPSLSDDKYLHALQNASISKVFDWNDGNKTATQTLFERLIENDSNVASVCKYQTETAVPHASGHQTVSGSVKFPLHAKRARGGISTSSFLAPAPGKNAKKKKKKKGKRRQLSHRVPEPIATV